MCAYIYIYIYIYIYTYIYIHIYTHINNTHMCVLFITFCVKFVCKMYTNTEAANLRVLRIQSTENLNSILAFYP